MLRQTSVLELCLVLMMSPLCALAQGPITPSRAPVEAPRTYDNSADGLRWQLQDLWNAARESNSARLDSLIKLTEIPDPNWFSRAFGQEKGQAWGEAYTKNLDESEGNLQDLMTRLAGEDGEFLVRNIKYEPAPAREIESTLVDSLRLPVNLFFASWRVRNSAPNAKSTPIGYFVFVGGRFRWDSAVVPADSQFVSGADHEATRQKDASEKPLDSAGTTSNSKPPNRPGVAGVGYPQCFYAPDPRYSDLARKKRLEGVVTLQGVVQPEGHITDVKVLKSPDPELSDLAVQAVGQWRCRPARLPDGEAVPVVVSVDVNFRLLH